MVRFGAYVDLGFILVMFQQRFDYGMINLLCSLRDEGSSGSSRSPGVSKKPWRIGDELSFREAKGSLRGLRIARLTREGCS